MSKRSHSATKPPFPPPDLTKRELPVVVISKHSDWFRIFRNNFKKPEAKHFGWSKENRFDVPQKDFGVLYLANSIHCSVAEVWLRDPNPENTGKVIAESELNIRSIATFKTVGALKLVDLATMAYLVWDSMPPLLRPETTRLPGHGLRRFMLIPMSPMAFFIHHG